MWLSPGTIPTTAGRYMRVIWESSQRQQRASGRGTYCEQTASEKCLVMPWFLFFDITCVSRGSVPIEKALNKSIYLIKPHLQHPIVCLIVANNTQSVSSFFGYRQGPICQPSWFLLNPFGLLCSLKLYQRRVDYEGEHWSIIDIIQAVLGDDMGNFLYINCCDDGETMIGLWLFKTSAQRHKQITNIGKQQETEKLFSIHFRFVCLPDTGNISWLAAVSRQTAHQHEWSLGAGTCLLVGGEGVITLFLSR